MTPQIKTFGSQNFNEIEKQTNEWLKENISSMEKIKDIKHILYGDFHRLMIIYEE